MKIYIIRHGDPDYSIDSLTEKGWKEAEYLAERISKLDIKAFYMSPLGRAKDTASLTLKKMNRSAQICDWLQEFPARIWRPDETEKQKIAWDWLPQDWTKEDCFYDVRHWTDHKVFADSDTKEQYQYVCDRFDRLLASYGYEREGRIYRVKEANEDAICLFCHFGLECVLLAHLLDISPMVLWHGFCAAPTSVTTVVTEERRKGIASFRIGAFGDVSHLYVHQEPPAFSARFCECFDNEDQRHD